MRKTLCVQAMEKQCTGCGQLVYKSPVSAQDVLEVTAAVYKSPTYTSFRAQVVRVVLHTKNTLFSSVFTDLYTLYTGPTVTTTKLNI